MPNSAPSDLTAVSMFGGGKGDRVGVVRAWALEPNCLDPCLSLAVF